MRSVFLGVFLALMPAGLAAVACNVHDNTIEVKNPKLDFDTDVNVDDVTVGESVPVHMNTEAVFLVDPDSDPPPEHKDDAGHFQIYLDDTDGEPLVVTAQTSVSVKIPEGTSPGHHKLICRAHKHDGTPTNAEFEIDITVKASVSVGSGGSMDSGAPMNSDY